MPRPTAPAKVDRTPLTGVALAAMDRLIDTIYVVDTLRPEADILRQAVAGFRLAWQVMDGEWRPRIVVQLGPDLVMRNPAASLE